MSKKKGLGQNIEKSMEIMEELLGCLTKFQEVRLMEGLRSNMIEDPKLEGKIEKALLDSAGLKVLIKGIRNSISGAKPKGSQRFASQRVLSKFLTMDEI